MGYGAIESLSVHIKRGEKCPMEGKAVASTPVPIDSLRRCLAEFRARIAEIKQLKAFMDTLPKFADGSPIVVGMYCRRVSAPFSTECHVRAIVWVNDGEGALIDISIPGVGWAYKRPSELLSAEAAKEVSDE